MFLRMATAVALICLSSGATHAGEYGYRDHRGGDTFFHVKHSSHHRWRERDQYSGDVAISSIPGVGTWSYGSTGFVELRPSLSGGLKMIDVESIATNDACSFEHGVCVIRP